MIAFRFWLANRLLRNLQIWVKGTGDMYPATILGVDRFNVRWEETNQTMSIPYSDVIASEPHL
jgi:hypothetical protein